MKPIQLLYARNIIPRNKENAEQELAFLILVENLAYDKEVDVVWAGEDGIWRTSPAGYQRAAGDDGEIWYAQVKSQSSDDASLPGDIQFALRYRVLGKEYWDNNCSKNYSLNADSGVQLAKDISLLDIDFNPVLYHGQRICPVAVAVRHSLHPKHVSVHWTIDHWRTVRTTPCFFKRKHWDKAWRSNARNPNQYDCEIWISQLNIDDAYRVEYAIACQTDTQTFWDNNFGKNYIARRERIKILTLNLHCYQEENQDAKFTLIAKAIEDLDIDIVCLQEVCEHWNGGHGNWGSNAARIIRDMLRKPYHLHTDWSHIGFHDYREGIAILSKYEILAHDAGYVSSSHDFYNIHARKVVMTRVHIPYVGFVNVFSAHLSWWSDGFVEQFERVHGWASHKHADNIAATLLCGDFNVKAGSEGYMTVVNSHEYEDQFLKATSRHVFERFSGDHNHQQHILDNDGRIDYIFMKKGSRLEAMEGRVLFTESDYGRVSDHYGYYVEFEPVW